MIGQVPGDQVVPKDYDAQALANDAGRHWGKVKLREHPLIRKQETTLTQDLERAHIAITHSSTGAVESILRGIPTITLSRFSIAYPVSHHAIDGERFIFPRRAWCSKLGFRQWTLDELEDGSSWGFWRERTPTRNGSGRGTDSD